VGQREKDTNMQLTGPEILRRMQEKENPDIVIEPFDIRCLGSNSYDLHLADTLRVYEHTLPLGMKPAIEYKGDKLDHSMRDWFTNEHAYNVYKQNPCVYDIRNPRYLIDPTNPEHHKTIDIKIPETGLILSPDIGYLGSTVEYTETRNMFPYIDGKSSVGRNFILNHHTAGRGDDGFCGEWTLEIRVLYPTVVYPYMRIGQIYYEEFTGNRKPYDKNKASHYNRQVGPTPAAPIPVDNFLADMVQKKK
jgi:dCTP deaminase